MVTKRKHKKALCASKALCTKATRKTDPVEDILKQFENQTQKSNICTHNEHLNNIPTGNCTSDTQQGSTQQNTKNNHNQRER